LTDGTSNAAEPFTNLPSCLLGKVVAARRSTGPCDGHGDPCRCSWQALFKEIAMATRLSQLFKQRRLAKGLRVSELARLCGYKNLSKGSRRINDFEDSGGIDERLFVKLANILGVDETTIARLAEQDQAEFLRNWNEWADQPIKPHVIVRAIPGFLVSPKIPPGVTTQEEMEQFAANIAEKHGKKVWLVLNRRTTVYFNQSAAARSVIHAKPGASNCPYMSLKSRKKKFLFTADGGRLGIKPLNESEQQGREEQDR
jgi:transcriptional regulator with XRE-family HTH domain